MSVPNVRESFFLAAQELGMWTASSLFLRTSAASAPAAIASMREQLAADFPVFDAMAERWIDGAVPTIDPRPAARALGSASRVLMVGFDADPFDALIDALDPSIRLGLLAGVGELCGDLDRVLSNYAGRVERVELSQLHGWAGRTSALGTLVYGVDLHNVAYTSLAWLRALGPDVRTQFRRIVGWNLLGAQPERHPRWVVATPGDDFSDLVGP